MDHNVLCGRSRHLKTTKPMHVGSQRLLVGWPSNMHGRHPETAKGPSIILIKVLGLLIGDYARAVATPSPRPTKTAFGVTVGHCNDVLQA